MDETGSLLLDRVDDVRVAVTDIADADAACEVDERVAVDVRIDEFSASAAKTGRYTCSGSAMDPAPRSSSSRERGPGISVRRVDRFGRSHGREPTAPEGGYSRSVDLDDLDLDPHLQFDRWFAEAAGSGVTAPEQMALATARSDGRPSVRMVLLKGHDARGFVFYTNRESRKATELESNPWAAVTLHWETQSRQIRVEGAVERLGDEESLAYFQTRARASQMSAWASPQSQPVAGRDELERRVAEIEQRFDGLRTCHCRRTGVAIGSSRR